MKIVVTGGNGLVGNNLKSIVNEKYSEHSFTYLNKSKNDDFSLDLTDRTAVLDFFSNHKFDYIIHLAANVGGLFKNLKNNANIFKDNIMMQENILEACNITNIQRGIFCLSSCIYPHNPNKFPMTEKMILESAPHYSNKGYGYAKRMLYIQCQNYNKDFNREYICVAPVNMYGKYDNFSLENGHFISTIMHRFHINRNEKQLIAYGTGSPLRQLLYAEDAADIMCKLLFNPELTVEKDLINITNDKEYTIKHYVEKIGKEVGVDISKIHWDTSKSDGCLRKTVSNNLLKNTIPNYKFTNLEEGLKKTYEWFTTNFDNCRK
tara:strand:- start:2318 stop:3277 length:960 start_codon:yes stop_codon:yes gene_type:complete